MFVDGMAFPLCNPKVDLGNDADQAAMARTVEKSSGGPDGYGSSAASSTYPEACSTSTNCQDT
jgi:hypothetical protein